MIRTLVLATVANCAFAAEASTTCAPLAPGWVQSRADRTEPVNTLVLNERGREKATWNGAAVTSVQIRSYLELTAQMSPRPVLLLIVSPNADCVEVGVYRRMASEVLRCGGGRCVEVDP